MSRPTFLSRTERRAEAGWYLAIVIGVIAVAMVAHLLVIVAPWMVKWLAGWLALIVACVGLHEWLTRRAPRDPEDRQP